MKDIITVGLDGSPASAAAALWAADEARLRHARLQLLHAWPMLGPESTEPPSQSDQNQWSHRIIDEARTAVQERCPDLAPDVALVREEPLDALLTAATRSDLLVLGSRDLGTLAGYFVGELGLQVMARADVPTVLIRSRQAPAADGTGGDVVLGMSLHEPCDALVRFAFDAAARRRVSLRVLHGRHLPAHAYNRGGGVEPYVAQLSKADAQLELAEALRSWREQFPRVGVEECVGMESPAPALLHGSAGAGLLVVGRRHRHHLLSRRIGHVVHAVVHHAPCPVAVVPHE
ncbi:MULTISPECIES: universal stress protein [unclassified Streptomyces]|uniref:universal stress protein n=1 Tax=Streptomyces TaxID=1883 RepID=UPI00082389AB|nr:MULTISPECIES: universal stress protein [unclassified Streptomyces]AWN30562.1 hypothetical protein DKG71_34555 [Streptomyces sp. NEAU-S7GS2]AWN30687.1 hypothetical protein DKG71_35495 [Streptomyces sp. NEAU-S7GS2]MYT16772.1 universal stress protein [Streptomyces sp. SID4951]SCK35033.1 Nucleotide-binding universal stress protein, UspA family [Streptomyces sp. SceaMP-e96]